MEFEPLPTKSNQFYHTTTNLPCSSVILQYIYYLYYMILMTEKMPSQNK
jgi:hypothetical protein